MSDIYGRTARSVPAQADMAVDAGLRAYMLAIYNKMGLGLLLSGALAYFVSVTPAVYLTIISNPILLYGIIFGPLALILISSFAMRNPSPVGANLLYWSIVSLFGLSFGLILLGYAQMPDGMLTVAKAFLVTAATFGGLSLWGYTTKRDLSGWGTFLYMAVWGLVIASLVNIGFSVFTHTSITGFSLIFSAIAVVIFSGLTAYKTQMLKWHYYDLGGDARAISVGSTLGALTLYITFINLFLNILRLMSSRR